MALSIPFIVGMSAGCSSSSGGADDGSLSESSADLSSNESTAFKFFVSKGLSRVQSAAIVGNLIQESSVLPASVQFGGGPGRGIAQWSVGGRWNASHNDNLESFAASHKMAPLSLETQLEFVWYELTTFPSYGLSRLRGSSSLSTAVVVFQDDFEGCGVCDQTRRIEYAQQVLNAQGGGSSSGGSSGGHSTGGGSGCYSNTLGNEEPDNACVQSKYDSRWYQCDNGSWVNRWTDPTACNGVHPL
jgi:hypothetical protein